MFRKSASIGRNHWVQSKSSVFPKTKELDVGCCLLPICVSMKLCWDCQSPLLYVRYLEIATESQQALVAKCRHRTNCSPLLVGTGKQRLRPEQEPPRGAVLGGRLWPVAQCGPNFRPASHREPSRLLQLLPPGVWSGSHSK